MSASQTDFDTIGVHLDQLNFEWTPGVVLHCGRMKAEDRMRAWRDRYSWLQFKVTKIDDQAWQLWVRRIPPGRVSERNEQMIQALKDWKP
jgi:hypothetical protein